MSDEILTQRNYWNREADVFQKIYTHQKSAFSNFLDSVFRKDMYDRFVFTIENCKPVEGRTFLDVGCGNGLYSRELAKKGAERVVGIDIADTMIRLCEDAAKRDGVDDRCEFLLTDLLAYEPTTTFDVSFGIGLFDYVSDPLPVLRKMREVSADKAILAFPRFWTWRAPIRKLRLMLRGCPVYFYTRAKVNRLCTEAGFGRVEITRVGKLHCVVAHVK